MRDSTLRGRAARVSATFRFVPPTSYPSDPSTATLAATRSPEANSDWRYTHCGDVWNRPRRQTRQPGAQRWR